MKPCRRLRGAFAMKHHPHDTQPSDPELLLADSIEVRHSKDSSSLHALAAIPAGANILQLEGDVSATRTRHSVQIGEGLYIDAPARELARETPFTSYRFRALNHACDPNARFVGRVLQARRDIAVGEEICFDYTTTELSMVHPFRCTCAAANCLGTVQGFAYLSTTQQRERTSDLQPHLLRLISLQP
jgi:hypothetical protein